LFALLLLQRVQLEPHTTARTSWVSTHTLRGCADPRADLPAEEALRGAAGREGATEEGRRGVGADSGVRDELGVARATADRRKGASDRWLEANILEMCFMYAPAEVGLGVAVDVDGCEDKGMHSQAITAQH
jgi:hypothetical protein